MLVLEARVGGDRELRDELGKAALVRVKKRKCRARLARGRNEASRVAQNMDVVERKLVWRYWW